MRPIVETARKIARKYKGGWIDRAKYWFRKPMKRTPLSDEFKTELEDLFREDVRALSSLLERDLMHWVGENSTATSECKNDEAELVEVS